MGWMNEWMNKCLNEWMNGRTDKWTNEWIKLLVLPREPCAQNVHAGIDRLDGWMNGWIDGWMGGQADRWTNKTSGSASWAMCTNLLCWNRQMGGINEWMNEWIKGQTNEWTDRWTTTVCSIILWNGLLHLALKLLDKQYYNFAYHHSMEIVRFRYNRVFSITSGKYSSGTCPLNPM